MDYTKLIKDLFGNFKGTRFAVKLWDGRTEYFGSGSAIAFTLHFKDHVTIKKLLSRGSIGFGESFMDGGLIIEGDLDAYLRMRRQFSNVRPTIRLFISKVVSKIELPNSRENQISYHYDLGNDFFRMLLDKATMSYSAGLYLNETDTLDQSQINKYEYICRKLDLPAGSSILDLGSGWGGFAIYAAEKYKWHVTGYTLSNNQLDYCNQLVKEKSLNNLVRFEHRDILKELPGQLYDGAVMIESIEHIGKRHLPTMFQNIKTVLKPGKLLYVQTTGQYIPHSFDRWTLKYVFPGGYLPGKEELSQAALHGGFNSYDFKDNTDDYKKTMNMWIHNLEAHRLDIEKNYSEPVFKLWLLWMHGAKINFETGWMNLFRFWFRS